MESTDSSSSSQQPHLPPGFRFHPTDEELVVHYLKKKATSAPLPVTIIADVDLYKFDPWELPGKATFGEQEWYFFSPRDRKYPNGARPNRAATSGYWKATGTDKPILTAAGNQKVGVKKALVFYGGRPPKGVKTNWIMHEYRLVEGTTTATAAAAASANNKSTSSSPASTTTTTADHISKQKASLRLDDWVLCRIYKKNNSHRPTERHDGGDCSTMEEMTAAGSLPRLGGEVVQKPGYGTVMDGGGDEKYFLQGFLTSSEDQEGVHNQVGGTSSKSDLSLLVPNNLHAGARLPPKRSVASPYWHHSAAESDHPGGGKRLNTGSYDASVVGGESGSATSSFTTTLLNQVVLPHQPPAAAPFHHSYIGNVVGSDGIFRQPYSLSAINWGS